MAEKEKKKHPQHVGEYMDELRKKKLDSLDDAFSHYDTHMNDDNQNHLLVNVFGAAMDDFYDALAEGLKDIGDDTTTLKGKEENVKKAVLKGFKAYLKKTNPEKLEKLLANAKDEMEQYKILSTYMDLVHPLIKTREGRPLPIDDWIDENFIKRDKKISDMKVHFYRSKSQIAEFHREIINGQYENHLFGTYDSHDLTAHIRPDVQKKYDIKDEVDFANMQKEKALKVHRHLKYGKEIEDIENYGIKPKGDEEGHEKHGSEGHEHH